MRRITLLVLLLLAAFAAPAQAQIPPKPAELTFVNDYAGILSTSERQQMTSLLSGIERATGAEVIVVAAANLGGSDAFSFAQSLFTQWGIGKSGADNGLLILFALQEREFRFHTGYGLEAALPDVVLSRLYREQIVPSFAQGRYFEGLMRALAGGIVPALEREYGKTISLDSDAQRFALTPESFVERYGTLLILLVLLALISNRPGRALLWFMLRSSSMGRGGGGFGGGGRRGFGGGRSGGGGAGGRW